MSAILLWMMSGGNFCLSVPASPGLFTTNNATVTASAPAGPISTYAWQGQNTTSETPVLTGAGPNLLVGYRKYIGALGQGFSNNKLIRFFDVNLNLQCYLAYTAAGLLQFYNASDVPIGPSALVALPANTWQYIEAYAIFSNGGGGTCAAWVNGASYINTPLIGPFGVTSVNNASGGNTAYNGAFPGGAANAYVGQLVVISGFSNSVNNTNTGFIVTASTTTILTVSNPSGVAETPASNALITGQFITNAQNSAGGFVVDFRNENTATLFWRDAYTATFPGGTNNPALSPLNFGDVEVAEIFPNGVGVHSAWTPNVGPFTVTTVAGSGSSWTFTGSWTQGGSNAFLGYNFTTTSCGTGNNQTGVECTASAAGSITLSFSGGSAQTGLTGTLAFQCIVQAGINQLGTRPNGDNTYIADATTNDISDFAHQTLILTGTIIGVEHLSLMRKDDAGTRQVAQVCLSSSATEQSSTISLGNSYTYYLDIISSDPNTSAAWTVAGFNASTWGIKEIT